MFTGMYHSTVKCHHCGHISHSFEPFTSLPITIPAKKHDYRNFDEFNLEDCLSTSMNEEVLKGANRIRCGACGYKTPVTKQMTIWKSPKILVLQLKRFIKNMYGQTTRKIKNKVIYPIKGLDMTDYFSLSSSSGSKYDLVGVNIHKELNGGSSRFYVGHYFSYCKNEIDNNWYCYNDSKQPMKIESSYDLIDSDAYLLFYYKNEE